MLVTRAPTRDAARSHGSSAGGSSWRASQQLACTHNRRPVAAGRAARACRARRWNVASAGPKLHSRPLQAA
eukprot:scaffold27774_cov38-Tisochrysis_lutea.AAC.1